jgi:hypothetical protein
MQTPPFNHNRLRLKINNRKHIWKPQDIWKFKSTFLNKLEKIEISTRVKINEVENGQIEKKIKEIEM